MACFVKDLQISFKAQGVSFEAQQPAQSEFLVTVM